MTQFAKETSSIAVTRLKAKPMEDLDDSVSSTGFTPLFIREEEAGPDRTLRGQRDGNTAQSGHTFAGTPLNQSALIRPYLQEMDGLLLKSCKELTGISYSSHFTASYNETTPTEQTHGHGKEEGSKNSHGERSISPNAYLVTSYIDTHRDGAETEDKQAQGQSQCLDPDIDRCGVTTGVCCQRDMPLTSAGHKLSDTMREYEGKLLGMLAMLDSRMEEAGMDFEHQDWVTDTSQEYVHIGQNPKICRGPSPTLGPVQQGEMNKSDVQPMHLEPSSGRDAGGDEASGQSGNEATAGSATNGNQRNPMFSGDDVGTFSKERLERQGRLTRDDHFSLSKPSISLYSTGKEPLHHEGPKTGDVSTTEGVNTKGDVAEEEQEPKLDTSDLESHMSDLGTLAFRMEECIEEVQRLEERRNELLAEVLELRGNERREEAEGSNEEETEQPIDSKVAELINALRREEEDRREERKREIQSLREERAEEERRMWRVNLERQGLQEELRQVRRRLFAMARDCAQNQFALNTQQHEVELLKREEEKLQSLVLQLTEEGSQLRAAQQQQLLDLQAELHAQSIGQTSNTQDELSRCKRHSCGDVQQYLQGGLRALEDRYEPILLALLKRRELTAGALVKAKEQAQELRAQLRPLKEEIQKLKLQRACLEEKVKLTHLQRKEDVGQYKEAVYWLEESSRELKTELKIQKRKTREMEELRDGLTKRLILFKAAIEDRKCDHKEKT